MKTDISTEHIDNDQVKYYYDIIIQKVSRKIIEIYNSRQYMNLGKEEMYISLLMFEKFKIQFYSAIYLAHTGTLNTLNQFKYFDISSIHTIIRACYETFLTFHYIYMQPGFIGEKDISKFKHGPKEDVEVIKFKILLYKHEGYKQSYHSLSTMLDKREEVKNMLKDCKSQIQESKIFKNFSNKEKRQILKCWKPSWNKIASQTELSEWNSKNMYNIISQHSHNSYSALTTVDYYSTHLEEYDKDAMFMQLFEFTAILINEYVKLFKIVENIFTKDEVNLLNEFYTFAHKNPGDINLENIN